MKYRMGFVTNSSSSSYIVAFKMMNDDETERFPLFAKKLYNYFVNKLMEEKISTKQELDKYFLDYYCEDTLEAVFEECDYAKKSYDEWLERINNGYIIGQIEANYSDRDLSEIIKVLSDDETFVLIAEN